MDRMLGPRTLIHVTEQPRISEDPGTRLVRVRADRVLAVGIALWAVALVVTLAVPALHSGERHWWPWACVTGLSLGLLGAIYLRRGRGNAADADAPVRVPSSITTPD